MQNVGPHLALNKSTVGLKPRSTDLPALCHLQALIELFKVVFKLIKLIKLTDGAIPVVGKVYWECFKIQVGPLSGR